MTAWLTGHWPCVIQWMTSQISLSFRFMTANETFNLQLKINLGDQLYSWLINIYRKMSDFRPNMSAWRGKIQMLEKTRLTKVE